MNTGIKGIKGQFERQWWMSSVSSNQKRLFDAGDIVFKVILRKIDFKLSNGKIKNLYEIHAWLLPGNTNHIYVTRLGSKSRLYWRKYRDSMPLIEKPALLNERSAKEFVFNHLDDISKTLIDLAAEIDTERGNVCQ